MLHHTDGPSLQSPLRALSVLLFYLLLTDSCTGQFQLIGPSQSIVAGVGDDVILPCHLKPAADVTAETVEWRRADLNPRFIYVRRNGQALVNVKNPAYKGRTSMFVSELKHGNLSLKLFKVKPSDQGTYECHIPTRDKLTSVKLVVALGATSSPAISLLGIDRNIGGVILNCESRGWYPEPEVFWLDGEGNLLSAGPTETVRGPDDLYTVSSTVTVEKSDSFTCRVQQKNINQTRETHFYVPDDFYEVHVSAAFSTIIGLAVSLAVCILIILVLVLTWKWKQIKLYTKKSHIAKTDMERGNSCADSNKDKERVTEQLMTDETEPVEVLSKRKEQKKKKPLKKTGQQLLEEQQRREEAEKKVKMLEDELETKKKEVETLQTKLQELREEKQRDEEEMQNLKGELENKNKELEKKFWTMNPLKLQKLSKKKDEAENKAQDVPQREHKDEDTTTGHVEDEQVGECSPETRSNNSEAADQEESTKNNKMATRAYLMS